MGNGPDSDASSHGERTAAGRSRHRWDPHALGIGIRLALAWLLGISGSIAAIHGWGPVAMGPGEAATGQAVLITSGLIFTVAWRVVSGHLAGVLVVSLTGGSATLWLTAPNVGRVPALVTLSGIALAVASFGEWRPSAGWPRRSDEIAWLALVWLVAAQFAWVWLNSLLWYGLLLVATCVALICYLVVPETTAVVHRRVSMAGGCAWSRCRALARRQRGAFDTARERRVALEPSFTAGAAIGVLGLVMFRRLVKGALLAGGVTDFNTHLRLMDAMALVPFHLTVPQLLFHGASVALRPVLGSVWAPTVVLSLATASTVGVLGWVGLRPFAGRPGLRPNGAAAFAVLVYLMDSPALLAQALHFGRSESWAPVAHMWVSPTETILAPLAIVLFILLVDLIDSEERPSPRRSWLLALVAVAAVLAKPTLSLLLVVAIPAYLLTSGRRFGAALRSVVLGFAIPTAIVAVWQIWFLHTGQADFGRSSFVFDPMTSVSEAGFLSRGPVFWSPLLLLGACLLLGARRYFAEPTIALSWWTFSVSLVPLLLLAEQGMRDGDANLGKFGYIAFVMVWVFSWRFVAASMLELVRDGWDRRLRSVLIYGLTAIMAVTSAVGGLLAVLDGIGVIRLPAVAG